MASRRGQLGGVGGFRSWEDPQDPRRSRGAAPQSSNTPGLPTGGEDLNLYKVSREEWESSGLRQPFVDGVGYGDFIEMNRRQSAIDADSAAEAADLDTFRDPNLNKDTDFYGYAEDGSLYQTLRPGRAGEGRIFDIRKMEERANRLNREDRAGAAAGIAKLAEDSQPTTQFGAAFKAANDASDGTFVDAGRSEFNTSPDVLARAAQFKEALGLDTMAEAIKVAENEAQIKADRGRGESRQLVKEIRNSGEISPETDESGMGVNSLDAIVDTAGYQVNDAGDLVDPRSGDLSGASTRKGVTRASEFLAKAVAQIKATQAPFRQLDSKQTSAQFQATGGVKKTSGGRKNAFDKEPGEIVEDYPVPVLVGRKFPVTVKRQNADGVWEAVEEMQFPTMTVRDRDGAPKTVIDWEKAEAQVVELYPGGPSGPNLAGSMEVSTIGGRDLTGASSKFPDIPSADVTAIAPDGTVHGLAENQDPAGGGSADPRYMTTEMLSLGRRMADLDLQYRTPIRKLRASDIERVYTEDGPVKLYARGDSSGQQLFPLPASQQLRSDTDSGLIAYRVGAPYQWTGEFNTAVDSLISNVTGGLSLMADDPRARGRTPDTRATQVQQDLLDQYFGVKEYDDTLDSRGNVVRSGAAKRLSGANSRLLDMLIKGSAITDTGDTIASARPIDALRGESQKKLATQMAERIAAATSIAKKRQLSSTTVDQEADREAAAAPQSRSAQMAMQFTPQIEEAMSAAGVAPAFIDNVERGMQAPYDSTQARAARDALARFLNNNNPS